jgi:hypothetical protein
MHSKFEQQILVPATLPQEKQNIKLEATDHEDIWGSGDIAPCILNLSARWR